MHSSKVLALMLVLASCTLERGTKPTTESVAPEDAARAVTDSIAAAVIRMDVNGALQWYSADPSFTYVADGALLRGRRAFDDYMRTGVRELKSIERFDQQSVQAYPLGADAAVVTATYRQIAVDTGDVRTEIHGSWTQLIRRTPLGWRVVHGHTSRLPAEPSDTTATGR